MKMNTIGPCDTPEAFFDAIQANRPPTGQTAKLAVLYTPVKCDHGAFLRILSEATNAPVVGCSAGGMTFTERGSSATGVVAAILWGGDFEVQATYLDDVNSAQAVSAAVERMSWSSGSVKSLLVLANLMTADGEAFVTKIKSKLPVTCHAFGGSAGADWETKRAVIFCDERVHERGAVLVGFSSAKAIRGAVRHGYTPAPIKPFVITKSSGNIVYMLDHKPAVEAYQAAMVKLGLQEPGEDPNVMHRIKQLGIKSIFSNERKIRSPLYFSPDGSITLAGAVQEGADASIMLGEPQQLIDSARNISEQLCDDSTAGLLVFDCMARLVQLGSQYPDQVRAFGARPSLPYVGFATFGEIARFTGHVEGFHNSTSVLVALPNAS